MDVYEIVVMLEQPSQLATVAHGVPYEPTSSHTGYGVLTYEGLDCQQVDGLVRALTELGVPFEWRAREMTQEGDQWHTC